MGQMPDAVREVYDPLNRVAVTTHFHWQLMLELYEGEEKVRLLQRFGGILFGRIQSMMLADVVLGICRLTDPAQVPSNARKQSLSIPRLTEAVQADDPSLLDQLNLSEMLAELKVASQPFREMRNRILAHLDWTTRDQPRPVTNKDEIDKALGLAARIMNAVSGHYTGSIVSYTMYPSVGDGNDFMRQLRYWARHLDETPKRSVAD